MLASCPTSSIESIIKASEIDSTPLREEIDQQRGSLFLGQPTIDFWLMMALRLRKNARAMFHPPSLGISRAIIEPGDSGMGNRTRAHGTWFQRHIKIAIAEAKITQMCRRRANRDDFGMGGRVIIPPVAIFTLPDNDAAPRYNRANRHFLRSGSGTGKLQRTGHGGG